MVVQALAPPSVMLYLELSLVWTGMALCVGVLLAGLAAWGTWKCPDEPPVSLHCQTSTSELVCDRTGLPFYLPKICCLCLGFSIISLKINVHSVCAVDAVQIISLSTKSQNAATATLTFHSQSLSVA